MPDVTDRRLVPARVGLVPLVCALGALVIVAIAGLVWHVSPYYGHYAAKTPGVDRGTIPTAAPRENAVSLVQQLSPRRIVIPTLQAQAPIVKVGTGPDGQLDVPINPHVVGWWSPGAEPGAAKGTAIFAGHINFAGVTGTLADIGTLRPGDTVDVYGTHVGKRTKVAFRVTGVRTYHKTHLPYRRIFDQQSIGRLAIVTCGGPFDASTGNYLDNIVAFAVPR